ncbi:hypothetical protein EC957_010306 [Mortierella hygrophila]|uniref:Uncharacterized protein n=1 Tax=Mortierella hygrophila TaxID=979708 RepID=A0A9P6JXQ0_9FUNG|nr:hypothetical protein EC957_010306 [Mortierella hygrophila]
MATNTPLEMAYSGEPWPIAITNYLLEVDPAALEQEYYGPFNTMLTLVFPFAEHYAVTPQSHPNRREAVDYLIQTSMMTMEGEWPTNRCSTGSVRCTIRSEYRWSS